MSRDSSHDILAGVHPVRADAITRFLIRGMVVFAPSRRAISLALIPAVVLGVAVARNAVNVPVADQWELVRLFSALQEGHLSWRDVFAVHNEHRYTIPKLYFLGLGTLTKWDVRWEMWTTFLLACSTVLLLVALLETTEVPETDRPALAFLISLTVLNPALVENWLWGFQAGMLVPPLCLSAGIVIACRPIRPSVQLAASAALAFIASFSFGNGLVVWILIVAIICCSPTWPSFSHKRTAILFWCVALLVCLTLYLWGFPTTSNLEPFRQRASFGTTLEHWFGLLGAPLAAGVLVTPRRADIVCGALLLALFASGAVVTWRSGSRVMRGWVVFGSVSVITAAMVTGGRVGIDDANVAFTSRYLLFAGPMVIATGVLWTEYLSGLGGAHPSRAGNALVTTFVVLQVLAAAAGVERMAVLRENRLQGKALLAFIDHVEEPGLATKVYPWSGLRNHARALQELDYLRPPLVQVPWRPQNSPADSRSGRFERLTVGSSSLEAEGWAIRQERNEPADAVVLAVETAAGCCTVVAVADERERAPTLIRLGRRALANAGWRKSIAFDRLPADAVSMRAWAYDAMTGQSVELSGRHKIDR